jgi:hypothetical protein
MQEQSFKERDGLQRLLKNDISVIVDKDNGDDLFILKDEFEPWEDTHCRIDLLALDQDGNFVVIELKRSEDGGHMDLQALRYAAMISTMTFQQAVAAHAKFLGKSKTTEDAKAAILKFLGWTEPSEDFGKSVRIILVSPDFSKALTTTVLWLNNNVRLDISCIRIRPYNLQQRTLLEVDQIIPLREAQEYTVRFKEKQEENQHVAESNADHTRFDLIVDGKTYPKRWKNDIIWQAVDLAVKAGISLTQLQAIFPQQRRLFVVDGNLSLEAFLDAAEARRASENRSFDRKRYFLDDEHLFHIEGKTCALSNQWSFESLSLIGEINSYLPPEKKMSYSKCT